MNLTDRIREIGEPMITRGCRAGEVRAEVRRQLGVSIGYGGQAGEFSENDTTTPCGYCGQTGNGGHGGMCPNA
jgi:hypothetical protein